MPESYALMKAGATTPVDGWPSGRSFYGVRYMAENVYVPL